MTTSTTDETPASASTSARAIARDQLTRTILASARRQLATVGPAALSVRAVARDVGMVSSAVYRYFPSRDELLTALLVECFDEQGEAVETADAAVDRDDLGGRWRAGAGAFRNWAKEHPWDYALLYGSPVPGYVAPTRTVASAIRAPKVLMDVVADAGRRGISAADGVSSPGEAFHESVSQVRDFADADVPDDLMAAGLTAWAGLIGAVTLDLFGHLENAVSDRDAWFAAVVDRLDPVAPA